MDNFYYVLEGLYSPLGKSNPSAKKLHYIFKINFLECAELELMIRRRLTLGLGSRLIVKIFTKVIFILFINGC